MGGWGGRDGDRDGEGGGEGDGEGDDGHGTVEDGIVGIQYSVDIQIMCSIAFRARVPGETRLCSY